MSEATADIVIYLTTGDGVINLTLEPDGTGHISISILLVFVIMHSFFYLYVFLNLISFVKPEVLQRSLVNYNET